MAIMPKAFPAEFRDEVVRVARRREQPIRQTAKDFGISESCLNRWLAIDEIESGDRPGVTKAEAAEVRELKRRNRVLEEENLILRRAAAFFAKESLPK
jgi:transposase